MALQETGVFFLSRKTYRSPYEKKFHRQDQWIGLRENLQETIDFPIKYGAFRFQFSLKPIHRQDFGQILSCFFFPTEVVKVVDSVCRVDPYYRSFQRDPNGSEGPTGRYHRVAITPKSWDI